MEESNRFIWIPVLNAQPRTYNSCGVRDHGDRQARERYYNPSPRTSFEKISVEDCDGKQAHQRANATARLRDLKLHRWQLNDIPVPKDWDAK